MTFDISATIAYINPVYSGNPLMSTFANSEDTDAMQHDAAFHQCLHCL